LAISNQNRALDIVSLRLRHELGSDDSALSRLYPESAFCKYVLFFDGLYERRTSLLLEANDPGLDPLEDLLADSIKLEAVSVLGVLRIGLPSSSTTVTSTMTTSTPVRKTGCS
jgi:hypothetical protein